MTTIIPSYISTASLTKITALRAERDNNISALRAAIAATVRALHADRDNNINDLRSATEIAIADIYASEREAWKQSVALKAQIAAPAALIKDLPVTYHAVRKVLITETDVDANFTREERANLVEEPPIVGRADSLAAAARIIGTALAWDMTPLAHRHGYLARDGRISFKSQRQLPPRIEHGADFCTTTIDKMETIKVEISLAGDTL